MTSSRSPVLIVGLDSFDPAIARALAGTGHLPTLQRLFEHSAVAKVRNPYGLFVGALWTTFSTGQKPERHSFHCWDEIDVSTYARRLTQPPAMQRPFWKVLSDAGRQVAVMDVPHSRAERLDAGIQVVEWGCHDRHFGFHTWPPAKAAELDKKFGLHPVLGLDAYTEREFAADDYVHRAGLFRTVDEDKSFITDLLQGLKVKGDISADLLTPESLDLRLLVMGESHAVGHQQWHLHDETHPRFDEQHRAAIGGDPLLRVYRELDISLGKILMAAGDETTVLVLLSHGMGPRYDGVHLLDEVLTRIDQFDRRDDATRNGRHRFKSLGAVFPGRMQRKFTALAMPLLRKRAASASGPPVAEFATPEQRARQRFFLEPNNFFYGGVRLNLAGREPQGCVQPDEFDDVCRRLTKDLLSLTNVRTGREVVRSVERSDRWYSRSKQDTLPDLFVDWNRVDPIETVWSLKTGIIHAPYLNWRTGDHRIDGLLLAYGAGIPTRKLMPPVDLEDLAPSICARLGVKMDDVDGHVIPWLPCVH